MRRLLIVLASVVAVLAIGSFGLWRWGVARMDAGFAAWRQEMAAQGWQVRVAETTHAGWPLAVSMTLHDVAVQGGETQLPGGGAYTARRLTIRYDLTDPGVATVSADGDQSFRIGPNPPQPFTAERFLVTLPLPPSGPPTSAVLDAKTLCFAAPAAGLSIGLLQGNADWSRTDAAHSIGLRLSAEAIALPPPPAPQTPLGPHIASATFEGRLSGTLPPDPPNPAAAARAWRESGGALKLTRVAIGWGPLGVSGTASFALDAGLQPDASATLRLVGIDATLRALADARLITPRAAEAVRAVAGLLAHTAQGGGAPGVELPVTLHDGTVTLGMIPLATIGKLVWSGGG